MKNIILTGSNGLIGNEILNFFIKKNFNLILVDRKFKKKIVKNNFFYFKCNLSSSKSRLNFIKKINSKFNKIDIIINNAAVTGASYQVGWNTLFEKQSIKHWKETFEVNVTSVFHFSQSFYPLMKKSENPSIINIASMYGVYAPDFDIYKNTNINNPAAYSVSKSALIYLTKWLAKAMSPKVRVNAISPGGVDNNQSKKFKKQYLKKTSLKKMIKPIDIINLIDFLMSDKSKKITGQNFLVDGGWNG
jgi:NAD(P)-dependent dehydrogenase (short-subunit alcohol dehydrogenase family)